MIKNLKMRIILSALVILFSNCQKEEINIGENNSEKPILTNSLNRIKEERIVKITHNYQYKNTFFKVLYTLDTEKNKILTTDGDITLAKKIFEKKDTPKGFLFEVSKEEKNEKEITVFVFDTDDEVDKYIQKTTTDFPADNPLYEKESESILKENSCFNFSKRGNGVFYFYQNTNYSNEINDINRTGISYSQKSDLTTSNKNAISSFIFTKPYKSQTYIKLYKKGCFKETALNFYTSNNQVIGGISNLNYYTLYKWFSKKSQNTNVYSYKLWVW